MTFASDLARIVNKTIRNNELIVKKIVIDMGTELVMRTPVGNPSIWQGPAPAGYVGGRARANWQYATGSMPTSILNIIDQQGSQTVNKIIGQVNSSKAASIHWIANNLPYIEPLERGWSKQAPQGMLRLTVMNFQPTVDAVVKSLK